MNRIRDLRIAQLYQRRAQLIDRGLLCELEKVTKELRKLQSQEAAEMTARVKMQSIKRNDAILAEADRLLTEHSRGK